jgi:putative salt-induced outer membrane protein YdiY
LRSVFVLLSLCFCLSADVVILKNGDRLTGAIIKKDGGKLTIKSDIVGEVTMPWDKVESIQSDKPVYVALPDGKTVQGTVATSGAAVQVAGQSLPLAEVPAIRNDAEQRAWERLQRPGLADLWVGAGSVGFAGTQGNAETQTITASVTAARITRTDKTSINFSAIRASAFASGRSSQTAQAVRGGWGYARNLRPTVFLNTFNDYEYDRFQNLDLRFVVGGGAGYNAIRRERTKLELLGGAAYNRESFNTGLIRNSAEGYWGNNFSYRMNSLTTLTQSFRMFNNFSDFGAYRMNFDIGATTKLTKWLTWNLALSDRFLSNPVPGRMKNDFLYTTGLGFSFAR